MADIVRLAALCDHALVGQDGKVSLMGIFRNISVSVIPAQHPRMYLVCILALDPGSHVVRVQLRRPDGAPTMPDPPQLTVHAASGQDVNVIVELNNLNFAELGEHQFEVDADGIRLTALPLAVSKLPQPGELRVN
jgi:hypothetical protein